MSGGKSITPPILGTARTKRVPEALVMAILVGRDAWEDSVREIELMVRGLAPAQLERRGRVALTGEPGSGRIAHEVPGAGNGEDPPTTNWPSP